MTSLWIFVLLLHLLITAVFALLTVLGVLYLPYAALLMVFFVPPAGYFAALAAHLRTAAGSGKQRQLGVEKLTMHNEVYKNVFLSDDSTDRQTVPLQEALLINDDKTKRKLILDVLNSDTEKYVDLLSAARDDKDTEVSHYAATAMVEMMKQRELGVQRYEQMTEQAPQDSEVLSEYINYLGDYLDMGILDGAMLEMYRRTYVELIDRYAALAGARPQLCAAKLDTLLDLKDYSAAQETVDDARNRWPEDGTPYLMSIKLCSAMKNPAGIASALRAAKERGVYLTVAQREIMEFWSNGREKN